MRSNSIKISRQVFKCLLMLAILGQPFSGLQMEAPTKALGAIQSKGL